jgi:hypothetical protein
LGLDLHWFGVLKSSVRVGKEYGYKEKKGSGRKTVILKNQLWLAFKDYGVRPPALFFCFFHFFDRAIFY